MNVSVDIDIRERAKKGIDKANDTTVKMILAMLEVQEKESLRESGNIATIERRFRDYEQGKVVPLTLDELENRVRKSHLERMKSKR